MQFEAMMKYMNRTSFNDIDWLHDKQRYET